MTENELKRLPAFCNGVLVQLYPDVDRDQKTVMRRAVSIILKDAAMEPFLKEEARRILASEP